MNVNWTYGDHFAIHTNFKSFWYLSNMYNTMFISIKKKDHHAKYKDDADKMGIS